MQSIPDWASYWMSIAETVGSKSKCSRRQIGAVIVSEDQRKLVSVGYNGAPAGFPEPEGATCSSFCPRALEASPGVSYSGCVSCHSEVNALLSGDSAKIQGASIYVTSAVCWDCAKVVANSGIKRVVMRLSPSDAHREPEKTIDFLKTCGLEVIVFESE